MPYEATNSDSTNSDESSDDDGSVVSTPQTDQTEECRKNTYTRRRVQPSRKRIRPAQLSISPRNNLGRSRRSRRFLSSDLDRSGTKRVACDGESDTIPCKVLDYHVDYRQLQCLVELPADAMPGERFYVKWPIIFPVDGSVTYVIECPQSIELAPEDKRVIRVVAPGLYFDPLRKTLTSPLRVPLSEGKRNHSSVRVGREYQAAIVPLNDCPSCSGDEAEV